MFSVRQKREIADAVQKLLRDIENNGAVKHPGVNPWNETQDAKK